MMRKEKRKIRIVRENPRSSSSLRKNLLLSRLKMLWMKLNGRRKRKLSRRRNFKSFRTTTKKSHSTKNLMENQAKNITPNNTKKHKKKKRRLKVMKVMNKKK